MKVEHQQRLAVLAALVAASTGVVVLGAGGGHHSGRGLEPVWILVVLSFGVSGQIAQARRPDSRIGVLLVLVGFGFVAGNLELSAVPILYSIGLAFDMAWIGLLVHTLAVYPNGRLDSRAAAAFVAVGWISTGLMQVVKVLVSDPVAQGGCTGCPSNLFALAPSDSLADRLGFLQASVLGPVLVILGIATFVTRWRRASPAGRRAIGAPLATGMVALFLIVVAVRLEEAGGPAATVVAVAAVAAVFLLPVSLLIGVLRTRMAGGRVRDLGVRLAASLGPEELRSSLAWAVDDPTLTVSYWVPGIGHYVNGDGARHDPLDEEGRSAHLIDDDGDPLAAIVYDPVLDENPGLLAAAAATAGLALKNERLRAELRAQVVDLRHSRARILVAEEAERRRLERNLHDGAQQRLLGLGLALQLARRQGEIPAATAEILDEAEVQLRLAIEELRDLAHGLHPASLTEGGLRYALDELASRAPFPVFVRYRATSEIEPAREAVAYYVVSEALTNSTKHADPGCGRVEVTDIDRSLTVTVSDDGCGGADPTGSGLTGLADRVLGVGGRLSVHSPPRGGTRVRVELPCGS